MSRGPTFVPLSHALCLPVSLGEVLESLNQDGTIGIKYYIVDSRPISHFSKGHLPGSFHLDANLVSLYPYWKVLSMIVYVIVYTYVHM